MKAGSNGCMHIILQEAKKDAKVRNTPNKDFWSSGPQTEAKKLKLASYTPNWQPWSSSAKGNLLLLNKQ